MNNSTSISRNETLAETTVSTELNKVATLAFGFSAAVIGCWAVSAFFAAMNSGSPFGLLSALATAITG